MELNRPGVKHFAESKFCLACDIGQSVDPTAVAVIEHVQHMDMTWRGDITNKWSESKVRHLERLPLGTDYVQVVEHVHRLFNRPPLNGACDLVIDDTGVGKAVGDLFLAMA